MPEAAGRTDWKDIALRAKARVAAVYEDNKEKIRYGLDMVEVWGASGVMGWIHGRSGGIPKRLGIPLDIGLTVLFKGFAFSGYAGRFSADMHSIGNGFGAYWFGTMGLDIGQKALKAAKKKDGTPESIGHAASDAEAKDLNIDPRTNVIVAGERSAKQMGQGMRNGSFAQSQQSRTRVFY